MLNIVTIDPSLVSTAMTVNGQLFSIASENIALTSTLKYKKWFEECEEHCEIHVITPSYNSIMNYSDTEINKIQFFDQTSTTIVNLIDNHIDKRYNTLVLIEGYSYSSVAGPIIDLVTLGTLIRSKILNIPKTTLIVVSPSSLKMMAAKMTYDPIPKGKKFEYRNSEGVAGGRFTKHDIYKSLVENKIISSKWIDFLKENQEEIFKNKSIPKPIEDLNDSAVMYHIVEQLSIKHKQDLTKIVEDLKIN